MKKELWQSEDPDRYFHIPIDAVIYEGEFIITNSEDDELSVEFESILPYEISEAKADKIISRELKDLISEFGGIFKEFAAISLDSL